ncbi:hypothetical protein V9T40_003196 [Parthenolecanium corni]|uniref:Uncharacterized protein n=1 Tax=Parthenolecanium corni TaxID=536013 RepID=A0AAN9Y9X8_9HEMI
MRNSSWAGEREEYFLSLPPAILGAVPSAAPRGAGSHPSNIAGSQRLHSLRLEYSDNCGTKSEQLSTGTSL